MGNYSETEAWKEFIGSPSTGKWIADISGRLVELHEGKIEIAPSAFIDIMEEFPPLLQKSFTIAIGSQSFTYEDEILELEQARWLVGNALARLMQYTELDAYALLKHVEGAHAWEGFRHGLVVGVGSAEQAEKLALRYEGMISRLEKDPGSYSYFSSESENLVYWSREWKKEKSLDEAFEGNRLPYPVWVPAIGSLAIFMPRWPDILARVLSIFTLPPVMSDALWLIGKNWEKYAPEYMLRLLRSAPICMESSGQTSWNGRLLAPAILIWSLDLCTHMYEELNQDGGTLQENTEHNIQKIWTAISQVLGNRLDGIALAKAFMTRQFIYFKDDRSLNTPMGKTWQIACEALRSILPDMAINPASTFMDTFGVSRQEADSTWGSFLQTGILAPAKKDMKLGALFSILPIRSFITPQIASIALGFLERLSAYENSGLYTTEFSSFPEPGHLTIGEIYASLPDPAQAWQDTWKHLSALRYKLRQYLYGAQSKYQEPLLNFFLICGICTYESLLNGGNREAANDLLGTIKKAINDYAIWNRSHNHFLLKLQKRWPNV